MPFAALPSSPGFVQPQAPDWGRFAAQANEFLMKGAEMRERQGERQLASMDKSFAQASALMKYNSPEEKAKRKMEMMKSQFMMEVYNDYKLHPEKYKMTANGPVMLDVLEQAIKISNYRRGMQQEKINASTINKNTNADDLSESLNSLVDVSAQISGKVPTKKTSQEPKVVVPDTSTPVSSDDTPNDPGASGTTPNESTSGEGSSDESQSPPGGSAYYSNENNYWT